MLQFSFLFRRRGRSFTMENRRSTPPAGIVQRVLALISPRDSKLTPVFPGKSLDEMRPRALSSPAYWFEDGSRSPSPGLQQRSVSKESLVTSSPQGKDAKDISKDTRKLNHGGYAGSGARPKVKVSVLYFSHLPNCLIWFSVTFKFLGFNILSLKMSWMKVYMFTLSCFLLFTYLLLYINSESFGSFKDQGRGT